MQHSSSIKAIVIGAGIVGASTAYFLADHGVEVLLLDAVAPSAEATGAADGAVSVASKRAGPLMTAALSGIQLYRELASEGLFSDAFKTRSTFIIASSNAECDVLHAHFDVLSSVGVSAKKLSQSRLRQQFPVVSPAAKMAVEVRNEGHAIGYQIVHRLLVAAGIVVRRALPVEKLLLAPGGQRVVGVQTAEGPITADVVVVTAGNGSEKLLGLNQVLSPRKGQLLVTERAPALNSAMPGAVMSGGYLLSKGIQKSAVAAPARGLGLVIDPLRTGQFLIGGTREDRADKQTNDIAAVSEILLGAIRMVPDLADVRLLRSFAGIRTTVIDGLPLIGRLSGLDNAYVATGFEGDGICLGPITGKALAQLICGEAPSIDLAPFDPSRFATSGVAA